MVIAAAKVEALVACQIGATEEAWLPTCLLEHFSAKLGELGSGSTDTSKVVILRVQAILSAFSQHDELKYNLLG
jgi:hypothetical protein